MRYISKLVFVTGLCGIQAYGALVPQAGSVPARDAWQARLHDCFNMIDQAEHVLRGGPSGWHSMGLIRLADSLADDSNCVFKDFQTRDGLTNLWKIAVGRGHSEVFKLFLHLGAKLADEQERDTFFEVIFGAC